MSTIDIEKVKELIDEKFCKNPNLKWLATLTGNKKAIIIRPSTRTEIWAVITVNSVIEITPGGISEYYLGELKKELEKKFPNNEIKVTKSDLKQDK